MKVNLLQPKFIYGIMIFETQTLHLITVKIEARLT